MKMRLSGIQVKRILAGLVLSAGFYLPVLGETPSAEEMWRIIQEQQAEIERLRGLVEESRGETQVVRAETRETRAQVEATALAIEELSEESSGGSGGGWWERTSIGGYGELHANFFEDASNEIDFHRFVLFVNHEFNDWITLYTELEVEHSVAGEGKNGEVELEQAFVRMDFTDTFSLDAGLFLMPVGLLNEIHEPNTFYGVERNNIEARLIPTTWWEAGVKGNWRFENGLSIEAGITSGLDVDPSGVIRSGRQKVSEAINESAGYVARVKYTGVPGLELGASLFYQDDLAQSYVEEIEGLLSTAHVDYRKGGFRLRALYARWDLNGTTSSEAEEQHGYYIEPSYRWTVDDFYGDLGVYFRISDYEYFSGSLKENEIYEIGINYWPVEYVVFKADIQDISESDQYNSKGDIAYNLGVGYQF
ncbi:porin [Puniceicoccales bacterium CK1056]|uniref:Porin n=1 Tax=Oceanipulchritudo coccoides TaxID=2706888 RepID=A0A6B2LYW5_9BACT|nr:porin [Oceanipulchritudo coccoides]NDV61613.1 porin [Oceanipulchritudo coccoides]